MATKVTLSDVMGISKELKEDFLRVEDKLDKRLTCVESRVDVLENFKSYMVGMAAIIGSIFGVVSEYIWKKLTGNNL